jgi:restriction endonuclease S subunit
MDNLNEATLHHVEVPIPPIQEQQAIVERVKQATATIDIATDLLDREIILMTEYRTALIAEAVTGKLDVRRAD